MSDAELVKMARLAQRDDRMATGALYGDLADRIEELEAKLAECEARLGKAVELLKEARQDLEAYVTHDWPKDVHPHYDKKWERDMELCRRIDATLAEIKGDSHD